MIRNLCQLIRLESIDKPPYALYNQDRRFKLAYWLLEGCLTGLYELINGCVAAKTLKTHFLWLNHYSISE